MSEGTNGVDVKSKQAQKRARAKARKAAKAGENEDTNGYPMLSRSQSNASSDASQPFIPRSSPIREVDPFFILAHAEVKPAVGPGSGMLEALHNCQVYM